MKTVPYDKIRTYFKLNKKAFILTAISGLIFDGLMCLVPILQGYLIDAFKEQRDVIHIISLAVLFLLFVLFIQFNRFIKRYFVRDFSNRMVLQMRDVSFQNLIYKDISTFSTTSKGDLMNKMLTDIKDSAEGVRKVLTEFFDTIILLTGYFISMMLLDVWLTLVISVFFILSVLVAYLMKKIILKTTVSYKKAFSTTKQTTLNCIKNEPYYRGFGVSVSYYKQYNNALDDLEKKSIRSMILKGALEPTYQAIALIGLIFVIYFCGLKVMNEEWLIGTFSAYLTTFILVSTKVSRVGKVFNAYTTLKVSWGRCSAYLSKPRDHEEIQFHQENLDLKVSNLSFGFDSSFILHNISFQLVQGQCLGICGRVHSGKSTLGAALSGMYDYSGSIKLQGIELRDVIHNYTSSFIAYAPSEVELFNDTITYNVAFKDCDVTKALKDACLFKDVEYFKDKASTVLSHTQENLSGGQKKRLQIARALYNNPKLIVLDDPFNAIDITMSLDILSHIQNHHSDSILVLLNNQKEILQNMNYILFLHEDTYSYGTYEDLQNDPKFIDFLGGI